MRSSAARRVEGEAGLLELVGGRPRVLDVDVSRVGPRRARHTLQAQPAVSGEMNVQ